MCLQPQWCLTLCDHMDSSPPGSSVRGFPKQEYWSGVPCPAPGESSWPRDWTRVSRVSCIGRRILYHLRHQEASIGQATWGHCLSYTGRSWNSHTVASSLSVIIIPINKCEFLFTRPFHFWCLVLVIHVTSTAFPTIHKFWCRYWQTTHPVNRWRTLTVQYFYLYFSSWWLS